MKPTLRLRTFLALAGSSLLAIPSASAQTVLADSYLTSLDVASPTTLFSSLNFPSILNGPLTGSSTLTHTGFFGGQLSLVNNAGNTFTGNITVDSGTLRIAGSPFASNGGFVANSMTASDTITVNRAGTLLIDDNVTGGYTANRFGTSGDRPAVTLAGGTINLSGLNNATSSVQTFGALTSSSGQGTINVTRNSNGNPTLTFDSLAISSGSLLTFNGTNLGTGTNDARITFSSAPTLTNGILAGARFYSGSPGTSELATYGANGVTALTTFDLDSNDISGATSTQNVKASGTLATLTTDVTVNSLTLSGAGPWSLGGKTLTIGTGMLLRNTTNGDPNITNGTLTAGNGTDDIDLHVIVAQNNMTIGAVIADNGSSNVTLVKSGDSRSLTLNGGANNTYTGGTSVVGGTLSTGNVANRTYLGTGKVTVDGGASFLNLGNIGATSNSTGADYTAINGGLIKIASGAAGAYTANDTFNIGAGSVIYGASASGQGLASLDRGIGGGTANITLAEDAIIGHDYFLTTALNLTTGTIKNLGTNADLYYGFNGASNQTNAGAVINIGTGTAFKGLALYNGSGTFDTGTINVASGTTDVYIKTNGGNTAAPVTFTMGYDYFTGAGGTIALADAGTLDVNVLGNMNSRDSNMVYGDTSTGRNVVFVATAGSNLQFGSTAATPTQGMGSGTGVASARIENGGSITTFNQAAALNGAVTVQAGGRFDAALAGGVTGSGQLTFNEGSILNITNATGFSGSQATAASIAAGTIVRLNTNFGAAGDTLDSYLSTDSPIYQVFGGDRTAVNPTDPGTTILTLNRTAGGVGGILTNDGASRTFGATANGRITLGANGGVMAMTTGTTMNINEDIHGAGPLIIGTTDIIDGAPKLGTVNLNTNTNAFTGGVIINAGTLRAGVANTLGTSLTNQVTVNTGGTLDMSAGAQTIGNLTGTGGIINAAGRILTIGQGDTGGGNFQGSIQGTGGALTKTGTGTITLSGANTYTGVTRIDGGVLAVTSMANGGSNSGIGASTNAADRLVFGAPTATLRYTGSTDATTNRSFTMSSGAGGGATIESSGTGTLSFDNTVALAYGTTAQTRTLTLGGTNTGNNTFGKVIANNTGASGNQTSLVKAGAGTWVLNQTNTYSGTTSINDGTLAVNGSGSINSSAVTINGGEFNYNSSVNYTGTLTFTSGTLSGTNMNGSLSGLTIGAGQTLAPGNSPGTATTGSQTWATGGDYEWEINSTTGVAGSDPGWDLINGSGTLNITATAGNLFNISITSLTTGNLAGDVVDFSDALSYNWLIADFATITGFDATDFNIDTTAFSNPFTGTFGITLGTGVLGGDASQIYLTYTAIPEPAAALLGSFGLLTLLRRRRH